MKSIKEILERKNIKFEVDKKTGKPFLMTDLSIDFLNKTHQEIITILKKKCSLEEKQKEFESLSVPFFKSSSQLKFLIPPIIKVYIEKIEDLINKKEALEHHIGHLLNKKTKISKKRIAFLNKWHIYLQSIHQKKESFSLLILKAALDPIQTALFPSKSNLDNLENTKDIFERRENLKKDILDKGASFEIPVVSFLSSIRKNLLRCTKLLFYAENGFFDAFFTKEEERFIDELLAYYLETSGVVYMKDKKDPLVKINNEKTFFSESSFFDFLKKKSQHIFCIPETLIYGLSEMWAFSLDLPMLHKPLDWRLDENKKLNWGGYAMNAQGGIFPGVHAKSQKTVTHISSKNIETINYLQTIPFIIEKKALKYLDEHFLACLEKYLKDIFDNTDDYKYVINIDPTYNKAVIESYDMIREKNLSSKTIKFKNDELDILYHKTINSVISFVDIFFLANALKKFEFYYPVFIDSRGRIYYTSGHGLHPQGNKIARFLLTLKSTSSTISKREFYDESIEVNSDLIGLDVTCSGAQIIGGIIKDENILLDTNFFIEKSSNCEKKCSIYTEILILFLEQFKNSDILNDNKDAKNKILEIITRDFIKGWTMRFLYSEGHYSRVQYLLSKLNSENNNSFSVLKIKEQNLIAFKISNLFVESFKFKYPKAFDFINNIKEEFKKHKKQNPKPEYIIGSSLGDDEFISYIDSAKMITKQFKIYSKTKESFIKTTYRYPCPKRTLDLLTLIRAIVPNFIHHLDSVLLYECVLKLKKSNIEVFVIHDCFYLSKKYEQDIKQIYYETFIEKILNGNCYYNFLKLNGINTINDNTLLQKLNLTKYEMSPYILTI